MLTMLIDDLLELSIVGSFSRIGSTVRRRQFDWSDPPPDVMRGRTVLVTGPTSGLGRAMAGRLAGLGARVVLVGRDPVRLGSVRDELDAAHGPDCATVVAADMRVAPLGPRRRRDDRHERSTTRCSDRQRRRDVPRANDRRGWP